MKAPNEKRDTCVTFYKRPKQISAVPFIQVKKNEKQVSSLLHICLLSVVSSILTKCVCVCVCVFFCFFFFVFFIWPFS